MIYDGLVYGESELIIQKGNTHNPKGEGQVRLMESAVVWRNGRPVIEYLKGGCVHGLETSFELGLALFSQGRWKAGQRWFPGMAV